MLVKLQKLYRVTIIVKTDSLRSIFNESMLTDQVKIRLAQCN